MFIPYQVDVPTERVPLSNYGLIAFLTICFAMQFSVTEETGEYLVLDGWNPIGLFTHMLFHADFLHLIGNLIFLYVFGNAVCAKFTNQWYVPIFVGLGLFAALTHNLTDGAPAIGASGAINGVVGCFLILYPRNAISCFFILGFRIITFSLSSIWMILFWFAFDIYGAIMGGGSVGYFAHIGGFVAGVVFTTLALKQGYIEMDEDEETLLDLIGKEDWVTTREYENDDEDSEEEPEEKKVMNRTELVEHFEKKRNHSNNPNFAHNWIASDKPKEEEPEPKTKPEKIKAKCGKCKSVISAPSKYAGKTVKCPKCKTEMMFPDLVSY